MDDNSTAGESDETNSEYQAKTNDEDTTEAPHKGIKSRIITGLRNDKLALFGAIILIVFVLLAAFAPWIAPHDPDTNFDPMQEPGSHSEYIDDGGEVDEAYHLLGTNSFGNDMLSQIIFGARISLLVALATVLFAFTIGTAIGLLAGYYGGIIDSLLMRYVDFQWAFPELILAVGIIAISGGLGVTNVIIAIGIAFIDDFARIVRGEVLSIREEEYIMAARAIGMSDKRIMVREILPNSVAPIIVQATLMIPIAILAEAGLSFLGLGVKPTTPTWGLLLADGREFINRAWWISIFPGFAIMFTVLAFNMFGDGLRDIFDVKDGEVSEL